MNKIMESKKLKINESIDLIIELVNEINFECGLRKKVNNCSECLLKVFPRLFELKKIISKIDCIGRCGRRER